MKTYKLYNFKLDDESNKYKFAALLRNHLGISLTESFSTVNALLSDHEAYITTTEQSALIAQLTQDLNVNFTYEDINDVSSDHVTLKEVKAKTPAELWFDLLPEKEQEYVKELSFKYGLKMPTG